MSTPTVEAWRDYLVIGVVHEETVYVEVLYRYKSGADHGIQGVGKVAAIERRAHVGRHRQRRVVEDLMLMAHRHILAHRPVARSGPGRQAHSTRLPVRRPLPEIAGLMDDAKAEVLAFTSFPRAH
jgi:hypothetical protein